MGGADEVLTVALATTSERKWGLDLDKLPSSSLWRYLVVCQQLSSEASADLDDWAATITGRRPDIGIMLLRGRGVAASRNAALAFCQTEALLFTDDDVSLLAAGMVSLIAEFEADPVLDLIAGQTLLETGTPEKRYPPGPRPLTAYNCARIGTVELAVRPRRIVARGIVFDTSFGAGTENFLGDEYIFVVDCLRAGLKGAYCPIPLAVHSGPSSGLDFGSETATRARARVFERVFNPAIAPLVKLAFLWRHRARLGSLRKLWRFARVFLPRQST
ncbi:MAG: hypothetical protein ACYC0C_04105 [Devosia sp.]